MIAIVDYKAGNLTSVRLAFEAVGAEVRVTRDPSAVLSADKVVFPGVGAAGSAMANLKSMGLEDAVRSSALSGKPFLGICLGMQILFERSEEDGGVDTLGILPGTVKKFPEVPGCKIPHMGWNSLDGELKGRLFSGFGAQPYVYFVHSYCAAEIREDVTAAVCEYGMPFTAVSCRGNVMATQFHPEKSGNVGLDMLRRFAYFN